MDTVLRQYFGITLEDADLSTIAQWYYFPETDCYYCGGIDADTTVDFTVKAVADQVSTSEIAENNFHRFKVSYDNAEGESYCLTLLITGESYVIISNLPA